MFRILSAAVLGILAGIWAGCGPPRPQDPRIKPMLELAEAGGRVRLDDAAQRRLIALAGDQPCPCPGGGSLADCAVAGKGPARPRCRRAAFAVRALLRGLVRGAPDEMIRRWQRQRFSPGRPRAKLALAECPCRGPLAAPVTLVVFSDFQCPACAMGRHLSDAVLRRAGARVRLCFKNLPLATIHPRARPAARAALAAHLQGRFWAMHDRLFDNQRALDRASLIAHARAVGLDEGRFVADLDGVDAGGAKVTAMLAADEAEATALRLRGTPTFLVNGREVTGPMALPDVLDWIAEELALTNKR